MALASVRLAVAAGLLLLASASAQTATTCPGHPGCNLQQATCKQNPDSSTYSCTCNAGWAGSNCTQVAAPAPAPAAATIVGNSSECTVSCMHGACVKWSNGTSNCDCAGTPYIGPYCSVDPSTPLCEALHDQALHVQACHLGALELADVSQPTCLTAISCRWPCSSATELLAKASASWSLGPDLAEQSAPASPAPPLEALYHDDHCCCCRCPQLVRRQPAVQQRQGLPEWRPVYTAAGQQ